MGDIGFLLLIFFVILARAQDDSHVRWQPAKLKEVEMVASPLASVTIDTGFKNYLDGKEISTDALPAAQSQILGDNTSRKRNIILKVHKEDKEKNN